MLHNRAPTQITRRDIAEVLARTETQSGPVERNRTRSSLSALFSWAIAEGLCEINCVSGTAKADEGGSRERILSDAEIVRLWNACGTDYHSRIVRLLLLTGCRKNEIAWLRWSEIVGDEIRLPAERCKNGRAHTIPLAPLAIAQLPPRQSRDNVFPVQSWPVGKARLANAKLEDWRLHDLRRRAASGMQRLGVRTEVIEKALNHISGSFRGVAGIYQRDPMTADVWEALTKWADHITGLTRD